MCNVTSCNLVVLLENEEKQTNTQSDRQFWKSNLTVAEKGKEFQKSTKDRNRLYEIISTLQQLTHPGSSTGARGFR